MNLAPLVLTGRGPQTTPPLATGVSRAVRYRAIPAIARLASGETMGVDL
jgi:hypothetical protein